MLLFAICCGISAGALASQENTLLNVRVGPHKSFDRIVFEFESEAPSRIVLKANQKIEVRFADIRVLEHFRVPMLPRGLTVIKGIDVYREGPSGAVFEITLARDASPSELPLAGRPWRLALDLAPRVSENPETKPEYVPGDQPIPTRFAEVPSSAVDTVNPAQASAVLAYYYLAQGDTRRAIEQAGAYQKIAGTPLDLGFNQALQGQQTTTPQPTWQPKWNVLKLSPTALLSIALGMGTVIGFVIRSMFGKIHFNFRLPPRSPRPKKQKKQKKIRELADELESHLDALEDAIEQEPPRKREAAPEPPVESPEPEGELAETMMDRRVSRVLELSKDGRSVAAIAEELQMGQDEVKLILDLNQQ